MSQGIVNLRLRKSSPGDPRLFHNPPAEIAHHPLFSGAKSVGLITADAPRVPPAVAGGTAALEGHLHGLGLSFEKTHGSYGGPEQSFLVYNPTREQMHQLGHAFGQEAVVYSQNGKHELLYTHGQNAGKFHPSFPGVHFHGNDQPEDYYTHLPGHGYITLNFDFSKLHDSPTKHTLPIADAAHPAHAITKADVAAALAATLKKAISPRSAHPHAYPWHNGHTEHHERTVGHGVLLTPQEYEHRMLLAKSELRKDAGETPKPANEQAAGAGVSTYAKYAAPYGTVDKNQPSHLKFYPMAGKAKEVNDLVASHGYQVHYAGGKHGKADLANKNYNTGHLMIWDPSAGSGGDFGEHEYTDNWRKTHELAHALTLPDLNQKYGEGRRMGGLGKQRTLREAKRAVEWEWMAVHKQRELAAKMGIHVSDDDFHRELNTVMHDALHRAVTGKFTEPSEEGFVPHPHKVPLEHAHKMLDEAAGTMGLANENDVLKKALLNLKSALSKHAR